MNYQALAHTTDTMIATVTAGEQSARQLADCFAEAFFADAAAVSLVDAGQGRWCVTCYFRARVNEAAVRALAISAAGAATGAALRFKRIAAKDWVAESLLALKPITAGRFVVHGVHDRGCAPPNRFGIEIEAALAFGTGHHGSTRGCLLALDAICKSLVARHPELRANGSGPKWPARRQAPRASKDRGHNPPRTLRGAARRAEHLRVTSAPRTLDLGTGSGVLAIAAARAFRRRVLASDIDAHAVRIARDNARLNGSAPFVRVCRADGLAAAAIRAGAPFDLVFANILLAPLQKLAGPLTSLVAPRGRVILSGLLNAQANAARAAYPNFKLERRIMLEGWTTLVLKHRSALPVQRTER
jgi:ribosomal protein L11 methyltransferase